jgi:nucleoside-diphosphate-sugar epimerase
MCRKAAVCEDGGSIEVWGDGQQTRSFLYIDECIEATRRLMDSDFPGPVNIGSEEMIAINDFAQMAIDLSGKDLTIHNIQGKEFADKYGHACPVGVRGRNSDNDLIREKLGWNYSMSLLQGMERTYRWIKQQVDAREGIETPYSAADTSSNVNLPRKMASP